MVRELNQPVERMATGGRCVRHRALWAVPIAHFLHSPMKATTISLLALLLVHTCAVAGFETDIPQTNRVILAEGKWQPTKEQTQKALNAVQSFLEHPSSSNTWVLGEISKILEHTKDYRVQFTGILDGGRKVIRCNFFPAPAVAAEGAFDYWKRQGVEVLDGGFWFWRIYYDPSTGKCMKFSSNGYA